MASGMGSAQELESLKVEKERMDNIILPEGQLPLSTSNSPDVKLDEHITSRGDKNKITAAMRLLQLELRNLRTAAKKFLAQGRDGAGHHGAGRACEVPVNSSASAASIPAS